MLFLCWAAISDFWFGSYPYIGFWKLTYLKNDVTKVQYFVFWLVSFVPIIKVFQRKSNNFDRNRSKRHWYHRGSFAMRDNMRAIRRLTHWGRVTHKCVNKLPIIGSDNGLSPGRRQAVIWTNAGIVLIGTLGTNFGEILIEILTFSFKKIHLKMSSGKWRPSCLGLNELKEIC